MRPRAVLIVLMTLIVLGVAHDGHAFLRWLDKLSGPGPFVGVELKYRTDQKLRLLERGLGVGVLKDIPGNQPATFGFSLGLAASYENDLDYGEGPGVDSPTVYMMTAEASYEVWLLRSWQRDDPGANLFLSGGVSLNAFAGSGFATFVRPSFVGRVGWRWSTDAMGLTAVELGVEGHYYWSEFDNEEFGAVPGDDPDRFVPGVFGFVYW